MIYRTEFRNAVRIEQSINDEELIDVVNGYLVDNHYITDKEDLESVPELELDFILSILNNEATDEDIFSVYRKENESSTWDWYWIDDIVKDCIEEYFYDIPEQLVDLGDLVAVEYEKEFLI